MKTYHKILLVLLIVFTLSWSFLMIGLVAFQ